MAEHRVTMNFEDGAVYSFVEKDFGEGYLYAGEWNAPFPNTAEDSLVFGLMEAYAQGEGPATSVLWAHGEPHRVVIEEL